MSDSKPVSVYIMDKEYLIACEENERELLQHAVNLLNDKMQEVRHSGSVIGTERIAVMAALHFAHDLIEYKNQNEHYSSRIDDDVKRLRQKIDKALNTASA